MNEQKEWKEYLNQGEIIYSAIGEQFEQIIAGKTFYCDQTGFSMKDRVSEREKELIKIALGFFRKKQCE